MTTNPPGDTNHVVSDQAQIAQTAILAAESALAQGVLQRNRQQADEALADDFTATGHTGNVVNKDQYLAIHFSTHRTFIRFDLDDMAIKLYGETAVVSGQVTMQNAQSDQPVVPARYTAIHVRRGAQWPLVAWQETPITKQRF